MQKLQLVLVIAFILLIFIWRITRKPKPVRHKGLSIFYPLFVYLLLILVAGTQVFLKPGGTFTFPAVSFIEILGSIFFGAVLALPVLFITHYEFRLGQIYAQKNKTFVYIILGVILVRLALKSLLLAGLPSIDQLLLTLIMATVYLTTWRIGSFIKYRKFILTIS